MLKRKIIVNIATSADGYVARTDGNLDWLTRRPAAKGFYGLPKFSRSIDAKILGRKTFDLSVKMGANFRAVNVHYVFSRCPAWCSLSEVAVESAQNPSLPEIVLQYGVLVA